MNPTTWQYNCLRGAPLRAAFLATVISGASLPALRAQSQPAARGVDEESEEVFTLSPFEVTADANGYFQANAMSGTRLNSRIEDLGQSISVMTKDQMSDFAMLDVNDVFDYMASTEGTNTYSDFVLDRTGAVTDNVAGDPNNANRVRGIGNANIAFNNIQTTGRVPVDPLWLDSLELSRGPNANIFGLGNSSGTVNQVPATANLNYEFTKISLRGDSYGGWRTSVDHNQILFEDKLAVRASWAEQHTAFERKPSGEDARRLSVQFKAKPFENTTLALSWYGYENESVRPNFTTPRDFISDWAEAGSPAWNPVTRLITINGVTYGQGMVAGSTTPITTLPSYFTNNDARGVFRIGREDEAPYWSTPTVTNTTVTPANPLGAAVNNNIRFVNTGPANSLFGATQPLFATYRPLADKSIYDWEKINLMGNSKAWDDVDTYLAQIDQVILKTERQTMAGQLTFMREDVERREDLPMGPASVNSTIGEIHVDPNSHNLDGTPNPYFGRPYARTTEPFLREKPQLWDTTRAQVVYRLDFAADAGWTKWLGTQQLLGYYEYKDQENRHYAWRNTAIGQDYEWQRIQQEAGIALANRTGTGNQYGVSNNYMRLFEQYYLGDTVGGGIEYGPSYFPHDAAVPFVWGQAGNFRYDSTTVGWTPSPDGSGGNASRQTIVKTAGAVLQSRFLGGKLVTTFGLREDKVYDRNAPFATLTPDLLKFDFEASNQWNDASTWRPAKGETKTASVVARPFQDVAFLKDQARSGSGFGKVMAEAVNGLSLTYNKSDNFIPQGPAFDLFLRPLPNQTGHSEDYGFWMNMLEGRLSLRYNHYQTDQVNFRNGDISTIAQRVLRADGLNANDAWNLYDRSEEWIRATNPSWSQSQIDAERATQMGLTQEQMDGLIAAIATGTLAATQDVVSKGDELEINYNPTKTWTVSASVTKTESINQNAGSTIEDWIALRMPIWTTIEDPRFTAADSTDPRFDIGTGATGHLFWRDIRGPGFTGGTFNYNSTNSAATNFVTFVEGPLSVFRQLEGRPRPQLRKYTAKFNTRFNLSGISENTVLKNTTVGGSVRWSDRAAIGFLGMQSLPDRITQLDTNKPVYTPAETYVDLFVTYKTKLFKDVPTSFQFNVKNVGESGGGLLVTQVFPDGSPLAYRIIDPRQFILTVSFDM